MEQQLLDIINKYGIINYTFVVSFIAIFLHILNEIIMNFVQFIYEKTMYNRDKRKELKKNGS